MQGKKTAMHSLTIVKLDESSSIMTMHKQAFHTIILPYSFVLAARKQLDQQNAA